MLPHFTSFSEPVLRLSAFASVFILVALLEHVLPRRDRLFSRNARWGTNLTMVALGSLVGRALAWLSVVLAVPLAAVAAAEFAARNHWGLLAWTGWPLWVQIVITIVVLDFAIYVQHVLSHRVDILWRFHRMHHADVDFDVTTAVRFHPVEIGLSALYKVAWVLVLGPPAVAVVLFEVVLNACAMFSHANLALPRPMDRALRAFIVTPDMHRVHHSVLGHEHNSNFGFNLSIWDRLFSTYRDAPSKGHLGMTIGLPDSQSEAPTKLGWSLALPFRAASPRVTPAE
jgi:sterol desaturase/sphingolipid hydroxylase (fatty acid hydroxylase superfamily)